MKKDKGKIGQFDLALFDQPGTLSIPQDETAAFQHEYEQSLQDHWQAPTWLKEHLFFGFGCDPGNKIPNALCKEFLARLNQRMLLHNPEETEPDPMQIEQNTPSVTE